MIEDRLIILAGAIDIQNEADPIRYDRPTLLLQSLQFEM
jgi:hypothetical protein